MAKKNYNIEILFKALADRTRLRLISLIGDSEVCVCFFVAILKMSQPKISRHLAYLRRAGIVAARREGKWMHYRLESPTDPHATAVIDSVRAYLNSSPQMRMDRSRLVKLCCSPKVSAQLKRAPKPAGVPQLEQAGQ